VEIFELICGTEYLWYVGFTYCGNMNTSDWYGVTRYFPDFNLVTRILDCLCGLVVSIADYKHRGPGFDSRALLRIFLRELGWNRVHSAS
jgi:hypothetical protein